MTVRYYSDNSLQLRLASFVSNERISMETPMIPDGKWNMFLTLKEEKLLLVKRKHSFVVILPILFISCLALFFIASAYMIFQYYFFSSSLFFVTTLLLISIALSLITKTIVDWYFYIYILTSRKLLELQYTPLTSYMVSDVMLDRVNCTEIDLRTHGFLNEIIDMGDILITFDRPTHQEQFILKDVQQSHQLATYLTQHLIDGRPHDNQFFAPMWFKQHHASST